MLRTEVSAVNFFHTGVVYLKNDYRPVVERNVVSWHFANICFGRMVKIVVGIYPDEHNLAQLLSGKYFLPDLKTKSFFVSVDSSSRVNALPGQLFNYPYEKRYRSSRYLLEYNICAGSQDVTCRLVNVVNTCHAKDYPCDERGSWCWYRGIALPKVYRYFGIRRKMA
ncbi:MAG: hypothetical protein KatS3mg087_0471 [Patescibacteria group bacterium]|nr:MAG: hypothetical protein KatS3mg087_0471 [Patescibacteria group bacterium]